MKRQLFIHLVAYIFLISAIQNSYNDSKLYEIEGKIIGGEPAEIDKFSYAVLFFNHGSLCAGSVLNSYSVLTAAHCFDENMDKDIMYIQRSKYIQDKNAEIFRVLSFVIHEKYNSVTVFYADIALIFVKDPIKFGPDKQKALLVTNNKWMESTNKVIIGIGWGWTKNTGSLSDIGLLRTNLRFVPKRECEDLHRLKLTRDMFCLYGDGIRDTCKGDSGGGVIWNDTVIGVVSHGDGCAKKNKPSVYINVFYYRKWIKRQVNNFFKDYCKIIENDN